MLSIREAIGTEVTVLGGAKPKSVGQIKHVLFAPDEVRVVGFEVRRPDLAMAYQRKPLYLALDRTSFSEAGAEVLNSDADAWNARAEKRLGFKWDNTVIWLHMDAETQAGVSLGSVDDGVFDPATGELNALRVSKGAMSDVAVGSRDLPAKLVLGYDGAAIRLSDEAVKVETSGGAAKAAGRSAAAVSIMTGQVADAAVEGIDDLAVKTGKAAGTAIRYGKSAARVAAKSETGKKASRWLKSIGKGISDAMKSEDDD